MSGGMPQTASDHFRRISREMTLQYLIDATRILESKILLVDVFFTLFAAAILGMSAMALARFHHSWSFRRVSYAQVSALYSFFSRPNRKKSVRAPLYP